MEKLHLVTGGYLTDADLMYQDEVRGLLLEIADRIVELVYLKYIIHL